MEKDAGTRRGRGRPKLYDRRVTVSLSDETIAAIKKHLVEGESQEAMIRAAIERELERRKLKAVR